jgi:hypothetical protein
MLVQQINQLTGMSEWLVVEAPGGRSVPEANVPEAMHTSGELLI